MPPFHITFSCSLSCSSSPWWAPHNLSASLDWLWFSRCSETLKVTDTHTHTSKIVTSTTLPSDTPPELSLTHWFRVFSVTSGSFLEDKLIKTVLILEERACVTTETPLCLARVINSSKCWRYCCLVGWDSDKKGHFRCGLIDATSLQKNNKKEMHAELKNLEESAGAWKNGIL